MQVQLIRYAGNRELRQHQVDGLPISYNGFDFVVHLEPPHNTGFAVSEVTTGNRVRSTWVFNNTIKQAKDKLLKLLQKETPEKIKSVIENARTN